MTFPRVFLPQVPERRDIDSGEFKPVFDFSTAGSFGVLTPILDPKDNPVFLARLTEKIREALNDFDTEKDSFLAVGDPSVIAVCAGLILRKRKKFVMLKWDKRVHRYIAMEINV
jgi:hypothetical protein